SMVTMTVNAFMPYVPCSWKVLRSACMPAPPEVSDPAMVSVFLSVMRKSPLSGLCHCSHFNKNSNIYNEFRLFGTSRRAAVEMQISRNTVVKTPIRTKPLLKRPMAMSNVRMETAAIISPRQPNPARFAPSGAVVPLVFETLEIFSRQSAMLIAPLANRNMKIEGIEYKKVGVLLAKDPKL